MLCNLTYMWNLKGKTKESKSLMPGHLSCLPGGAHPQTRAPHPHRVRCQGQCHLESEKSHLGPCPDQLFMALEKRWAWGISVSTGALRHAFVTTRRDRCIVLDGHTPTLGLCESLGFSRQEHWRGLPFPSPMHESEK